MRYFKSILETGLTYKQALKKAKKIGQAITRPNEWDGIHIEINNDYFIILKDGQIVKNPEEIHNTERKYKDWAVVGITNRAVDKLDARRGF